MGFSTRYLISLLCVLVIDDLRLPTVSCQEQEGSRCLRRATFLALLRLPEVSSNLAAYSRTARIIQDAKDRSDYMNLKSLASDEGEDAKICLPAGVYLELFSDSAIRGHLSVIGRAQKMLEDPVERAYENGDLTPEDILESEKRSIATLAKNGDLPISIQDRSQDDEEEDVTATETARFDTLSSESLDGLMKILSDSGVEDRRNIPEIAAEYTLPSGELDLEALARDYPPVGKRNVAALARDFGLPPSSNGKRNIAAVARDYGLPSGKRNVGTLARDRMLPNGKRNIGSLRRIYLFPGLSLAGGKRGRASVPNATSRLRNVRPGKRYLGALARSGDFPLRDYEKRNMAALARNGDVYRYGKRNVGTLARDWSLPNQSSNRRGRSLTDNDIEAERFDQQLEKLGLETRHGDRPKQIVKSSTEKPTDNEKKLMHTSAFETQLANAKNDLLLNKVLDGKRAKRQIDYTDEYPLSVKQNTNVFDYEDMIEALTGEYPNTEKRFMGAGDGLELQDGGGTTSGYIDMYQPSKRHIGSLARLGWLPSFKPVRFSRSPRYLVGRKDPADGTATYNTSNSSNWTLNRYSRSRTRCLQSLQGDCRHSFSRNPPLPPVDNVLQHKSHFVDSYAI